MTIPRIPLGQIVEQTFEFVAQNFKPLFGFVSLVIESLNTVTQGVLRGLPAPVVGASLVALIWRVAGRGAGLFTLVAVLFIHSLDLWQQTMSTLALMATSVVLSLVIGVPIGIAAAHSDYLEAALTPVLDFMQTMPPFVYLIPAVIMLGIGPVPAVLATVLYGVPVPIRLTDLGIRQVGKEVIEAGEAFGCTQFQLLLKIKLPLALPVIIAAVNQTVMYSLGMVIIAAMIGAGGLGAEIVRGITRLQLGNGFEAGIAVVTVAVFLDRLGRGLVRFTFSEAGSEVRGNS